MPPSSPCERGHACAACVHISPELAAVPPSSACERGHACAACVHISPAPVAVPPRAPLSVLLQVTAVDKRRVLVEERLRSHQEAVEVEDVAAVLQQSRHLPKGAQKCSS